MERKEKVEEEKKVERKEKVEEEKKMEEEEKMEEEKKVEREEKVEEEEKMKKEKKTGINIVGKIRERVFRKEAGIDGILVTVGLCIIALLLCVVMKDSLTVFIQTIVTSMTSQAQKILTGTIS